MGKLAFEEVQVRLEQDLFLHALIESGKREFDGLPCSGADNYYSHRRPYGHVKPGRNYTPNLNSGNYAHSGKCRAFLLVGTRAKLRQRSRFPGQGGCTVFSSYSCVSKLSRKGWEEQYDGGGVSPR